jgi:hypothetical protein
MNPADDLLAHKTLPLLEGDAMVYLWVVGTVALVFIGYLLVDAYLVRKRNKKLYARHRQRAARAKP